MRVYPDRMVVRHSLAVLKQTLLRFGLFDLADNRLAMGTLLHKGDLFFGQISKQAPHRLMIEHFIQNIHVLILNQHHKVIFQSNVQLLSAQVMRNAALELVGEGSTLKSIGGVEVGDYI